MIYIIITHRTWSMQPYQDWYDWSLGYQEINRSYMHRLQKRGRSRQPVDLQWHRIVQLKNLYHKHIQFPNAAVLSFPLKLIHVSMVCWVRLALLSSKLYLVTWSISKSPHDDWILCIYCIIFASCLLLLNSCVYVVPCTACFLRLGI